MNTYLADTNVTLSISFIDESGNEIENIKSAFYSILDEHSNVILEKTEFDLSQEKITVEAKYNSLAKINADEITVNNKFEINLHGIRSLEFELTDENDNVQPFFIRYGIYPKERLILGLNSFQSSNEANLNAISMTGIDNWLNATENQRVTAMTNAYHKICQYCFFDNGKNGYGEIEDLLAMTKRDYEKFSPQFMQALKLAQVAYATEAGLASGGGGSSRLDDGIITQKIGETMEVYRDTVGLKQTLSKGAMRYLSRFIQLNRKIARG